MPLTAGEVVFAIDEDHIESVPDATALTRMGFTSTITELNYTDGVTSAIQTQLNAKQTQDDFLDDIAALSDPGADRGMFWDDSAGEIKFYTFGSGLTIGSVGCRIVGDRFNCPPQEA